MIAYLPHMVPKLHTQKKRSNLNSTLFNQLLLIVAVRFIVIIGSEILLVDGAAGAGLSGLHDRLPGAARLPRRSANHNRRPDRLQRHEVEAG